MSGVVDCKRDAKPRAAVCDDVHYSGACKLHDEHFHRYLAEFLGILVHFVMLGCVGAEYFQFAQSLNAVEEAVAH